MSWLLRLPVMTLVLAALAAGFYFAREIRPDPGPSIAEVRRSLPERLAAKGLAKGQPVFIRIFKEEAALEVWIRKEKRWTLFQTYDICRYSGGPGPKIAEGDRQSPEGFYEVGLGQLNPASRWHLSFNLGFPNRLDRALGRTGSFLMVHGGCSSIGCYAMTNAGVDDIYGLVEAGLKGGQPAVDVHAFPFRMTAKNMARHAASPWIGFWRDLKAGHDYFEDRKLVPEITVAKGAYRLAAGS